MAAAPNIKTDAREDLPTGASFEPHARLIRMLMPSVGSVVVHDGFANLVWSSDEGDLSDAPGIISETMSNALAEGAEFAGIVRTLDADRVVYSFAIRGEQIELLGVVSMIARPSGKQTEARPLGYVRPLIQPVLECLRREMLLHLQLGSRRQDLGGRERDLSLMLEMSSSQTACASDADEFEMILKTGLDHMHCALAALWVPEKHILLTLTRSGQPMSAEALQRAQQHLMAWMQLQQRTIVVNRISKVVAQGAAPYKILACPVRHPSGRVMGVLALFNPPSAGDFDSHQTRIAELLAKKATVVIQSHYDSSTGLMTRHAFERQAAAVLSAAQSPLQHCVLYLDIDRLHVINEAFGMHVGDDVIALVAECAVKALPRGALSARISGDRLAALVPNAGMDAAATVAENIRAAVAAIAPRAGQGSFEVSACVGVASIGRSENALAHALATAEIACKAAKDRGRNRVEVFQDSDQSIIRRHTDVLIVGQLRDALDNDRFRLDAQPILPLRANHGGPRFELLIRMLGDHGQIIPPGKFLSSAERYQLMPSIDRWVVRRACGLLGAHKSISDGSARFAVNLSGQSLQDDAFLRFVIDQIENAGLPANVLCFELTETATIGNLAKAQHFMRTLQNLGCQFALDDFGTGVSSLAYLKDLSVNYLKIDGSFVRDSVHNARSDSMIKAIAQLAKVMCMETIAEYVETDSLRVKMTDLGVDYGQGFAMGKSQPLEDLLEELAIYEATVSTWDISESAGPVPQQG
ncbi:MAG TPA: bifunctional diguanylate cyclase/phosphodiesterase [Steroidobacteraceae bacterium]|nr:bifunctional diguanylate cyclase/phosphodiesterase [Steroidobacteraceae bacterium]